MPLCLNQSFVVNQSQPASVEGCPYVVFTGSEALDIQSSPFRLSVSDASSIAWAIGLVWAAAWGIRLLADFLQTSDGDTSNE